MFKKILIALLCVLTVTFSVTGCVAPNFTEYNSVAESVSSTEKGNENKGLTAAAALKIAKRYWKEMGVFENGYLIVEAVNKDAPESAYVFALKHLVVVENSTHYSTVDEVWVDKISGDVRSPYDTNSGIMPDYEGVLRCYQYAVDYYNYRENIDTVDDVIDRFNALYGKRFLNEEEKQWFANIVTSGYELYPGIYGDFSGENNHACGYARKDLNGDGNEELVLLNADYTVIAIFSMKDGRPILLDHFGMWKRCKIDGNGYIVVSGPYGGADNRTVFYKIAEGGGSLEPLFEFCKDGCEWVDGVVVNKYYKKENGIKTYITSDEYSSLSLAQSEYYGNRSNKQVTEEDSGLEFQSLFGDVFTFSNYEEILKTIRFMTSMYNSYKIGIANREDFEYRYDLSTEYNREMYKKLDDLVHTSYPPALGASSPAEDAFAYAIKDLNGDGVNELVLIDGEMFGAIAVMTEKDGKIVFDTTYSFDCPSGRKSHCLYYWKNTVGLDLIPLYRTSNYFSFDILRSQARYQIEHVLANGAFLDVWVPETEEHIQLMDYVVKTPSGNKRLGDFEDLKYAFVDMDCDGVEELLIDCGAEFVILSVVYSSAIYLYCFDHRQIGYPNTDGSFGWNDTGEDHAYGESRIIRFSLLCEYAETETLWRIVNDGEPNAEYYIGDKKVTQEEILKYFEENPKTRIEFSPLEVSGKG